MRPEPLTDQAALAEATAQDPFVLYDAVLQEGETAYRHGSAVAMRLVPHFSKRPPRACVIGPDDTDAEQLLAWVAREQPWGRRVAGVSVERHREATLRDHFRVGEGGDWDWMWSELVPPRTRAEDRLIRLDDDSDAAEITRLNGLGNPTAESEPGTGRTERWVGARSGGELIGAAALHRSQSGHGVLTGIVTHPDHRGSGLGRAMTANLTRQCVEEDGVATLGMYAHNDAARTLYDSLGYRVAHAFASRLVRPL